MKKIFFFDIDGTLAIHGVIPEGNQNYFRIRDILHLYVQAERLFMPKIFLEILSVVLLHVMEDILYIKERNCMEKLFCQKNCHIIMKK